MQCKNKPYYTWIDLAKVIGIFLSYMVMEIWQTSILKNLFIHFICHCSLCYPGYFIIQ